MSTKLTETRRLIGNAAPHNPASPRVLEDYSIIRVIACRIAWLTLAMRWTHHPHERGLWIRREEAFEKAQICRGLLVIGSGLVDLDDVNAS